MDCDPNSDCRRAAIKVRVERYLLERRIEVNVAVNKLLYVSDKFLVGIFFKEQYRVGTHNCRRPI